jgi:hypothetical protein
LNNSNRREFLKNAGGMTLGLLATAGLSGNALACAKPGSTETKEQSLTSTTTAVISAMTPATSLPWPYQKLDPVSVADRAYANFSNGGCMYSAFETIIGMLRDKYGAPYNTFPTAMMKYGAVGIAGWGTICGALNGVAAAIYLFADTKVANQIINEVFYWHSFTALPDYAPANSKISNIPASIADSPLCHLSITNWCNVSGFKTDSLQRNERCARLTASVTRQTVNLLNQRADGTFMASYKVPSPVTVCLSCHGIGSVQGDVHTTNQTTCLSCHAVLSSKNHATTTQ